MRPLGTYQQILIWIRAFPEETATKWQKLSHIVFTIFIIISSIGTIVFSVASVLKHMSTSLEVALYATTQITGLLGVTYSLIVLYFLRNKIYGVFDNLKKIYDKCEFLI